MGLANMETYNRRSPANLAFAVATIDFFRRFEQIADYGGESLALKSPHHSFCHHIQVPLALS